MHDSFNPLLDSLVEDFGIEDRDTLAAALLQAISTLAERSVRPELDDHRPDTLDKLADKIGEVIALLDDNMNTYRLMNGLSALSPPQTHALRVVDMREALELYQRVAAKEHKDRTPKRGPLANQDLRAAVAVLVDYWVDTLKRDFSPDANTWVCGEGSKLEPTTEGERFVYRALSYVLACGRAYVLASVPERASELRSIANEFRRRAGN